MVHQLINLLVPRIVHVITECGKGTGSFIAPGKILTCAHVVREAIENEKPINIEYVVRDESGGWIPKKTVVTGHLLSTLKPGPGSDEDGHKNDQVVEYPDVAILTVPITSHPTLFLPLKNKVISPDTGKEFFAYGYQGRDYDTKEIIPQTVSLKFEGTERASGNKKFIFENGMIKGGMSGAPLVNLERGMIVGIVHETRDGESNQGAFVIPTEKIWEEFGKWATLTKDKVSRKEKVEMNTTDSTQIYGTLTDTRFRRRIRKEYRKEFPQFPFLMKNWVRIAILGFALFTGIWWVFTHYGTIDQSGLLAALLVVLPFIGNMMSSWFGKTAQFESSAIRENLAEAFIHPVSLIIIGVLVTYLVLFRSSIWIYGSQADAQTWVTLTSVDQPDRKVQRQFDTEGNIRFFVGTRPDGKVYKIMPEGMEGKLDTVYSVSKNERIFPKDFSKEAVAYLRLDPNYFASYWMKYYFEFKTDDADLIVRDSIFHNYGSIMIGKRMMEINKDRLISWAKSAGLDEPTGNSKDPLIKHWENYHAIDTLDLNLKSNLIIHRVRKSDKKVMQSDTFAIEIDNTDKIYRIK